MGLSLIEEFLAGGGKEIRDIANNEAVLVGFLTLAKEIDDLQGISMRFYEESRSLYQVTSSGRTIDELMPILSQFFGQPAKAPGKNLPVSLRFDPTVKYLGGIRKDQVVFLKKLKSGSFYGALWPWQRDMEKIEIHLGFCSPAMSDGDYNQLGILVKKFLSKKKIETISGVGGQIHGISLPSFLQMSEMEGATYALKVTSGDRTGHLFLDGGSLIAAQYEDQTGNTAAYRIISWDNAAIQIEPADPNRAREIHEPLMHVMMESLKIKDEAGHVTAAPSTDSSTAVKAPKARDASGSMAEPAVEMPRRPAPAAPEDAPAPAGAPSPTGDAEFSPPEPIAIGPFEKIRDRSMGKQHRMGSTAKLLIALGLVVVVAAAVVGGGKLLEKRQAIRRYEQLQADLAAAKALDEQIVLLMQYLKDHPKDSRRAELEDRLSDANVEIEKRDYDKTLADVDALPVDQHYEKKALSLYTAFLARYPQSQYAQSVNAAIEAIRVTLGTAYFQSLKALSTSDPMSRFAAYREYLTQFPQGAERKAVEGMIADLADEVHQTLEKLAAACDTQKRWDDCIAQCDRFLEAFIGVPGMAGVERLRAALQDKQDVVDLTIQAELAGDDYSRARLIYTDYLANRPDTTQKDELLQRIDALNGELAKQAEWEKTRAYASNPANEIFSRIQRVEIYIQNHPSGPYATLARNLRTQLDPELQAANRAQRQQEEQRQALARQRAAQARRNKEDQRVREIQTQVSRQLRAMSERYKDNGDGTVTDRTTGLTWCLLDSLLDLGRCVSYKTAKVYVQELTTGNRADWRLPTAGELATIYKSSPFFPASGADWYWTSESFVRGYHRVVDVVTSTPEAVFTRNSKNEDSCGHVRAVRR